jgi:hypothetical protein
MVIALLALILSIGGTSWAAFKLPRGSVTTASIRNGAITSSKVKDGSLRTRDFAPGALPHQGKGNALAAAGAKFPVAYAHIDPEGANSFVLTEGNGITTANVERQSPSLYCFKNLPFQPKHVQVTVDTLATTHGYGQARVAPPQTGGAFDFCTGSDIQGEVLLMTGDLSSYGDGGSLGFYVEFLG